MRTCIRVILIVWLAVQAGIASAEMQLQLFDRPSHDRFENDSAFIGNPYDWSGVGRVISTNTESRWATMISPNYFLSAYHSHPGIGSTLRFHGTNDPGGPSEDHVVASGTQIGGTDLWLGKLQTPVTSAAVYPILRLPDNSDYQDRIIHTFGKSDAALTDPQETNVRLGRNSIESVGFSDQSGTGGSAGEVLDFDFDNPTGGVGADESYLQSYDSGGPSFIITTIEGSPAPALVGIHWFIDDHPQLDYSVDTFVPEHIDQLNEDMTGDQVTVVPEPSMLAMLLGLAGVCLGWSVRRRASRTAGR